MSVDLAEFLLARIAEDEAVARASTPGPWRWDDDYRGPKGDDSADLALTNNERAEVVGAYNWHCCDFRMAPTVNDADAEHIARWDPARVLAECEAKRRVLAHEVDSTGDHEGFYARLLALPYADHSDYRPEWRP